MTPSLPPAVKITKNHNIFLVISWIIPGVKDVHDISVVLVGNKIDQVVAILKYARNYHMLYIETSARQDMVHEFYTLAREIQC